MRVLASILSVVVLALVCSTGLARAQSAIPKPADGTAAAKQDAPKTTAKKKAVKCEGLFEAACKDAEGCSWSGLAQADGSAPKGDCAKVDKTAAKGTKISCPTMFEALCKETPGCAWSAGAPDQDGKPVAGTCAFAGKTTSKAAPAKKATAAAAAVPPPAAPEPAPDSFTDQQEK